MSDTPELAAMEPVTADHGEPPVGSVIRMGAGRTFTRCDQHVDFHWKDGIGWYRWSEVKARALRENGTVQQLADSCWQWQAPTPHEACQVLWPLAREGYEPGSFVDSLIETMCRADPGNLAKLALGFPGYASAVHAYKNDDDGLDRLRSVAVMIRA